MRNPLLLFSLNLCILGFTSCQTQKLAATLQPKTLKAIDLEETLTLQDEIVMAYALSVYDSKNHLLDTRNGAWGVERVKKGAQYTAERFSPLTIPVPKGGRVVATMALIEVEDYQRAQAWVTRIRQATSFANGASALLELVDTVNPLKYLSLSLSAVGVSLDLAQKVDADDVLGTDTFEVSDEKLANGPRQYTRQLTFRGRHGGETYHYELRYDLARTTLKGR